MGSKDNILGAYGRDTLDDDGEPLLSFVNNHDLALADAFFSRPEGGVITYFQRARQKRYRLHPNETI